jgi:hypothetical protein
MNPLVLTTRDACAAFRACLSRRQGPFRRHLAFVFAAAAALAGCSDEGPELSIRSQPPTTEIQRPILSGQTVRYTLDVSWRGADTDGALHGFEIAIDDTAEWTFTSSFDSLLEFESAACCVPDTIVLPDSTIVIDSLAYGMHTLFVRAVDNGGEVDPTPARISFNATTITPEGRILRGPSASGTVERTPRAVLFEWTGSDADGEIGGYRYRIDDEPWVSVSRDCTRVRFTGLSVEGYAGDPNGVHEFTLLAVDNAGATERTVDMPANYRKWIASADVSWGRLCITEDLLGRQCGESGPTPTAPPYARLSFNWLGDASAYGGKIVCYSYSYDGSPFSECLPGLTHFPPDARDFVPAADAHELIVRARDDLGETFETKYRFVAERCYTPSHWDERQVLYIDDFALGTGTDGSLYPRDPVEEEFWTDMLAGFASLRFDAESGLDAPSARILSRASTVIWNVDDLSQLREGAEDPLFRSRLRSLILCGHNVILCGSIPSSAFAPDNFFDPAQIEEPGCPHDPRLSYGGGDRSLHWFPAFCDTGYHFAYDMLGIDASYYDGSQYLRGLVSDGRPLPDGLPLPDLVIDTGKRGTRSDGMPIFDVLGLELCEQYDLSGEGAPIPLWRLRDDDGEVKRVCAYWLPKTGTRGHVVVLGFSPYFFDTEQMQEVFRRLLIMFGENYYSDPGPRAANE